MEAFGDSLRNGTSGVSESSVVAFGDGVPVLAAEVRDFAPQQWLGPKGIRALDRSARLLAVAAHLCLTQVGRLAKEDEAGDPGLGLVCGTVFGSVHSIASFDWSGVQDGPKLVNPGVFPNTVINSPAGQAGIKFRLRGINSTISAGLASSLIAFQYASDFLRFGRASMLLAGGVEELAEESYLGFRKNDLLSPDGSPAPFSAERNGVVLGEGSALFALERHASARDRGAAVLAEVAGVGVAHDAHAINRYVTRADGAVRALNQALADAGLRPEQVSAIVSSAGGSRGGDAMELDALLQVFGDSLSRIPVCCPKAAYGETLGVSGALGVGVGLEILRTGTVPPTARVNAAPEGLSLSEKVQESRGGNVLVNAFSCDGANAALVIRQWAE